LGVDDGDGIMTTSIPIPSSSSETITIDDGIEKDIEIKSLHSHSISKHESDSNDEPRFEPLSMTEKCDIEAYPDGINDPQNEPWSSGWDGEGAKDGPVTRTSTKSSWKDPGPPPDGGWVGWTQGALVIP
jgi:hypothetical protein